MTPAMSRTLSLSGIAALAFVASAAGCTASQSWNETPEGATSEATSPSTVPIASTSAAPIASSVASATTAEPAKKGVRSCKEVTLTPTGGGSASACSDEKGIVIVAIWHLEGTGKARHASGTIDRFQDGAQSLHAVVSTDDASVVSALETAEHSSLDVQPEAGAIRVGTILETGEDFRTSTEIASIFLENGTTAAWTGLGTRSESEMDSCMKTSNVTFAFPDAQAHIERTTTSIASFTPQAIDAATLAKLKKGCVAAKPASKREQFLLAK
jgi:hypothetical protein